MMTLKKRKVFDLSWLFSGTVIHEKQNISCRILTNAVAIPENFTQMIMKADQSFGSPQSALDLPSSRHSLPLARARGRCPQQAILGLALEWQKEPKTLANP